MSIPKNSKQDWDVVTGWEKRIKVDFGSLGPNHVRWSHWTYKERDIVARKIHEITDIGDIHGNRSKKADDWRKENAPIIVDFARDGKPMPDWAHAEYRESGVPEHIQVIWKREKPGGAASKGDWDYDKPGPWDKGEEPAWSSKPKDPEYTGYMDKKYGGVLSYTENKETGDRFDTSGNLISTRESRAKEDVPNWRKFELGRLEDVDGQWVPGPNALPKDIEQYGENIAKTGRAKTVKPVKIMPGDTNHTPLEKALNWASESHHGKAHQNRWNRVAATMGENNGYDTYTFDEVKAIWKQFGKNPRWTVAVDWFDTDDNDVKGMVEYHFAPAMQGNYTAADFEKLWNQKPLIVQVKGWGKAIIDPKVGIPTYWLDGEGEATEIWERVGDDWQKLTTSVPVGKDKTLTNVPVDAAGNVKVDPIPDEYIDDKGPGFDSDTNRLDKAVIEKLPEFTQFDAQEFYEDHKGDSITWVAQREPSVGPHRVVVLFHNGKPVGRKKSRIDEFEHLPYWTKAQAEKYFIDVMKVGSYSRRSLDSAWNTVKGYCKPNTVEPIALAATAKMEGIEKSLDAALRANDWAAVAKFAELMESM